MQLLGRLYQVLEGMLQSLGAIRYGNQIHPSFVPYVENALLHTAKAMEQYTDILKLVLQKRVSSTFYQFRFLHTGHKKKRKKLLRTIAEQIDLESAAEHFDQQRTLGIRQNNSVMSLFANTTFE